MAGGVAAHCPADPAICPRAWRGDCRVRNRLGTEQRGRQLCDCRATYRSAVDAYTGALDVKLTAEDEAFIDSLVTPGHSSTPGFNDVGHFVSGRMART